MELLMDDLETLSKNTRLQLLMEGFVYPLD